MKFSEKYGFTPVRSLLQTDSMDDGLRNRLWNLLCATYFVTVPKFKSNSDYLPNHLEVEETFHAIWSPFQENNGQHRLVVHRSAGRPPRTVLQHFNATSITDCVPIVAGVRPAN
jgi:hypothetical protein